MLFTGYSGWIDGVREWLDVDDYSDDRIDTFLQLANERLNIDLMSTRMEKVFDYTVLAADEGMPIDLDTVIPDFNKIRLVTLPRFYDPADTVAINEWKRLELFGADTSRSFYSIDAMKLNVYPKTKEDDVIEIRYYTRVPPITVQDESNIFTEYHANILLYGAALEAAPYMAEDERTTMWAQMYKSLVDNVNTNSPKEKMGSVPLRRHITGL